MVVSKRNATAIRDGIIKGREHAALYGAPGSLNPEVEGFYMTLNIGAKTTKKQIMRRVAYKLTYARTIEKRLRNLTPTERENAEKTNAEEVRKTYKRFSDCNSSCCCCN